MQASSVLSLGPGSSLGQLKRNGSDAISYILHLRRQNSSIRAFFDQVFPRPTYAMITRIMDLEAPDSIHEVAIETGIAIALPASQLGMN